MKIGVIVLMVGLLSIWSLNMRQVFRDQAGSSPEAQVWNDIKAAFEDNLDNIGDKSGDIDKQLSQAIMKGKGELLAQELIRATKQGEEATSSEAIASTTATTSIEAALPASSSACPAYVNCMPTIGQAPVCQIPPGCEGITELVY